MKIKVKLFGTLGQDFEGYDPVKGLEVNIPDGARVKDLLAHLDITASKGCFVSMNNIVVKDEQKLINNATLHILQVLAGG